jgi:hypothetical protein
LDLKSEDWRSGNVGILNANPLILEDSNWLLLWMAFTIGKMSADQHKKIDRRTTAIKQNASFEKSL